MTLDKDAPSYKAFKILHCGYVAIPLIAGIDKFFDMLTQWSKYLAPAIANIVDNFMSISLFMKLGGVAEIATAVLVFISPRLGGFLVAIWMWCIVINLLIYPGYFDVALRDFGLSVGALALGFSAIEYHDR